MLEIRRGTAVRNYENTFFRKFAENLKKFFDKYSIDGLLIGNSECEAEKRLQIDALLITNDVVCIIDFKNFGGKIKLPKNIKNEFEFGKWTNDSGERIKGGNSINPFIQLKIQKRRFINVCKNKIIPKFQINEKLDPFHTIRMVCFQKPIELAGSIPANKELNFFIVDKDNYLEKIKDIIDIADKEVKLSQNSFNLFKKIFRADKFDIKETYNEKIKSNSYSPKLNYDNLYPDQKSALQEITNFIKSDSKKVFVLQGTSLSGKSHLIPFIEDIAYNNEIAQIEFFASSSKVATNLLSEKSILNFNSLYSYIYGGGIQENNDEDEANLNQAHDENTDKIKLKIVPLKKSDNEDKAVFIVDEAQLVSDNYYQSIDLRFGSGRLLEDFINFTDLKNSNRKIIFIGDNFQLSIGEKEKNSLNPEYLKNKYKLETKDFQLIDKEDKSLIVKQALQAVNGIRNKSFNQLSFEFSENLKSLDKKEILPILKNRIENNSDFHLLNYSNADAQKVNYWIKRNIIQNEDDIAENDLIIFNNNFKVEDENDPFAEPKKVFNGQFGTVTKVDSKIISKIITPKGKKPITLKYREVSLILKDTGHNVTVLSLENYRLSEKGELSKDEIIALKILLNKEIKIALNKIPFEKLDATKKEQKKILSITKQKYRKLIENKLNKDISSKYYKYKNAAYLRFGWALTVHKSMSYKWDEIFFNVDQGENRGKMNEDYFKWVYTGLTRAKEKVNIINYKDINPFLKMKLKDANTGKKPDKKIFFITNPDIKISETEISLNKKFNFPEDKPQLIQLLQLINLQLESNKIIINSINHPNYQELYELKGGHGEIATVSFYYNNKGQIKIPTLMKSEPKEFGDEVINILLGKNNLNDFAFIKDKWRKNIYTNINQLLKKQELSFKYIIQVPFEDTIKIIGEDAELLVDMYYDADGFYSSIIATYYNNDEIWNSFKKILNN